jgi:hypothetical protein
MGAAGAVVVEAGSNAIAGNWNEMGVGGYCVGNGPPFILSHLIRIP